MADREGPPAFVSSTPARAERSSGLRRCVLISSSPSEARTIALGSVVRIGIRPSRSWFPEVVTQSRNQERVRVGRGHRSIPLARCATSKVSEFASVQLLSGGEQSMRPKELGVVLFAFSGFYLLYEGALLVTDFLIRLLVAGENRGLFDQYPFGIFFAALPIFGTLYAGVGCIVWRNPLSARFFRESQASGEVPASTSMVAFEDWRAFWVGLVGWCLLYWRSGT